MKYPQGQCHGDFYYKISSISMSARHENTKCHPDQQCREPGEEGEGRGEQEQAGQGDQEQEQAGFFFIFISLKMTVMMQVNKLARVTRTEIDFRFRNFSVSRLLLNF